MVHFVFLRGLKRHILCFRNNLFHYTSETTDRATLRCMILLNHKPSVLCMSPSLYPNKHSIHRVQSVNSEFTHCANCLVTIPAQPLHSDILAPNRRCYIEHLELTAVHCFKIPQKRPGRRGIHSAAVQGKLVDRR